MSPRIGSRRGACCTISECIVVVLGYASIRFDRRRQYQRKWASAMRITTANAQTLPTTAPTGNVAALELLPVEIVETGTTTGDALVEESTDGTLAEDAELGLLAEEVVP